MTAAQHACRYRPTAAIPDNTAAPDRVRETFHLAIVGGGPRATYALERLSATIGRLNKRSLCIHIYDITGEFGSGQVHSIRQPETSFLNRACHQVGFAADPTVAGANPVREPAERPTMYEWCRRQFEVTGDPAFDLGPTDSPSRRQHGLALREMFNTYIAQLQQADNVSIMLHAEEVVDLAPNPHGGMNVVSTRGTHCTADKVLLITGHSTNDYGARRKHLSRGTFFTSSATQPAFSAYPLEERLSAGQLAPGASVGCQGLGLTAIDQILYLTEGRGGRFIPVGSHLRYEPSGQEPARIVAFSDSGLFPYTRALNYKSQPHQGRFFTNEAIDCVRQISGIRCSNGRPRLDFDAHVMPLIALEMAWLYYATLFSDRIADMIAAAAQPDYTDFLTRPVVPHVGTPHLSLLLPKLETTVQGIAEDLRDFLLGQPSPRSVCAGMDVSTLKVILSRWLHVVYGPELAASIVVDARSGSPIALPQCSPWGLSTDPTQYRFNWQALLEPIETDALITPAEYRQAYLEFLDRDLLWAAQGNADNPLKASVDGVWRDLRHVISYAVDRGGLTADSHRRFLHDYRRYQNKIAGGAALVVMTKIRALIAHGVLEISVGPQPRIMTHPANELHVICGTRTTFKAQLDVLLESRVHPFDALHDVRPLYRNLLGRRLARLWRNVTPGDADFIPGYLDLDEASRLIDDAGDTVEEVTVLGPAAAACGTYQFSAFRPNHNDAVMREIVMWLNDFWSAMDRVIPSAAPSEAP